MYCVHTVPVNIFIYEGEATRLAELALIFIPIYNVALSSVAFPSYIQYTVPPMGVWCIVYYVLHTYEHVWCVYTHINDMYVCMNV